MGSDSHIYKSSCAHFPLCHTSRPSLAGFRIEVKVKGSLPVWESKVEWGKNKNFLNILMY